MVFRRLIVAGAALGLLVAVAGPVAAKAPNPDGYTVNTLVTGPTPDADLVNAWGLSRLAGSPWWVADNGTDLVNALQRRRIETGRTPGLDPGWRPNRHRLERERGRWRLPWRPVPVQQRGRDHHRLARRPRDHRRGRATTTRGTAPSTRASRSARPTSERPQQYLYATDFHNGKIDVFDKRLRRSDVGRGVRRPEAPQGLRPVRHPEPQRHDLRDVREDPAGQR